MPPVTALEARAAVAQIEHTGDLGLAVSGASLDRLFEAALLGLCDVIVDAGKIEPRETRTLALAADDRELLLVRLLAEAIYLYDASRWLPAEAAVAVGDGGRRLTAELRGEVLDPERHEVKTEVKAVTYHALRIEETAAGLRGQVILDL